MEWIDRLNDTIAYIEGHLTEKIDHEQIGQITCCSSYHFTEDVRLYGESFFVRVYPQEKDVPCRR